MVKLLWGAVGERFFEAGVDRGVLYPEGGNGVAWNGLTSVEESPSGGGPKAYYIDGFKYLNIAEAEEFEATLNAFSAPAEFALCEGTPEISSGLFVTQQPRRQFGLSYRTLVGNDIDGTEHGYKIHLVYNALAAPAGRQYDSLNDSPEASPLSWNISTAPARMPGIRPTAHLIIDSRRMDPAVLAVLEGYLYGSDGIAPRLPSASRLISWLKEMDQPGWVKPWNSLENPLDFKGVTTASYDEIRNLVLNPRGRKTSGTIVVRENLYPNGALTNPNSGGVPSGWLSYKSSSIVSEVISTSAGTNLQGTFDGVVSSPRVGLRCDVPGLTSNEVLTASMELAQVSVPDSGWRVAFYFDFYNASGGHLGARTKYENISNSSAGNRITYTFDVPQGATKATAFIWLDTIGAKIGMAHVTVRNALLERLDTAMPFFDGSTSPDPDLTPRWVGAAGASNSQLVGPRISTWQQGLSGSIAYYSATQDAIALFDKGVGIPYLSLGHGTRVVEPITMLVNAWSKDAVPFTMDYRRLGSGDLLMREGSEFRRYFPDVNESSDIWAYRKLDGDRTIYAHAAIIDEEYFGPLFDGSTEDSFVYGDQKVTPEWSGIADASESVVKYSTALPDGAKHGDMLLIDDILWAQQNGVWERLGTMPSLAT